MTPTARILSAAIFLAATALPAHAATTPTTNIPATPGTFITDPTGALLMRGQTEPAAKVEVPSPIRGQLLTVDVREGQLVKKGEQLAKLDDELQQQSVALARQAAEDTIEIRGASNQVDFAQNEYDRIKSATTASSPAEVRQKELTLKQSQLGLELKKAEQTQNALKLKREQITLDHMTIRSPIDGYILRVNKEAGEQTDDNPLIVVVQTNKLHAVFFPPHELFGKIKEGDRIQLDFGNFTREATAVAVDPALEPASQLFRVKFEVDNTDNKIPPGTAAIWTYKPENKITLANP